jgi:hypothetical protein
MANFNVSAGFDLNVDLLSALSGFNAGDNVLSDVGETAPNSGPISNPAPWVFQWQVVPNGNSAGAVWSGVQLFITPDAQWARKASRAFSNGAMTFTPWLKVNDFNCPGIDY